MFLSKNCTFTGLKGIKKTREVATTSNPNNAVLQEDSPLISVNTINIFIVSINSSRFIDNNFIFYNSFDNQGHTISKQS